MKVGIFDSGIGGLSVLHLALKMLPNTDFIYLADKDHVPYGEKTKQQIIGYVDEIISFMVDEGCDAIVIACNTATSAAVDIMRAKYNIPIIGMEPSAKLAIDTYGTKRILVCATPVTVQGEKMKKLLERIDPNHIVDLLALPKLVRFAERLEFDSEDVINYLKEELKEYDFELYDALVLGCTHFNYFKEAFRKVVPESVHFVDGNAGTVHQLMRFIKDGDKKGNVDYYFSKHKVIEHDELRQIEKYLSHLNVMFCII